MHTKRQGPFGSYGTGAELLRFGALRDDSRLAQEDYFYRPPRTDSETQWRKANRPYAGGLKKPTLPSPWQESLSEVDGMPRERLELHCIGGFVLAFFYGLPRPTGDIDYYTAIPANLNLEEMAGQDSPLHHKRKVWLHRVVCSASS